MTVFVCPSRDIECGDNTAAWCIECPKRSYASPLNMVPINHHINWAQEFQKHYRAEVSISNELCAFLDGTAPLEGVWFGEQHPAILGKFWWRKYLPEYKITKEIEDVKIYKS